jgi:hemolysin activation/secretion protein
LAASLPHTAAAQSVDAGSLRQQIEQDRRAPSPEKSTEKKESVVAAPQSEAGPTTRIDRFDFEGNTLLTDSQLRDTLTQYVGQDLSFRQLQAASTAIAAAYKKEGWVVRTFLPKQDLGDGVCMISIVESRMGDVSVKLLPGSEQPRVRVEIVKEVAATALTRNTLANTKNVDRALLLTDDLPGISAKGSLAAGSNSGESDLLLTVENKPAVEGDIKADNAGSPATGSEKITGNLRWNSPRQVGDQLSAMLLKTEGSGYARISYTLPVGYGGWRAGLNASTMNYKLVGSSFAATEGKGSSDTQGVEGSYALTRGRDANLSLTAALDRKTFDNASANITTTRYESTATTVGISGNLSDMWMGGGRSTASLTYTRGNLNLTGSPNEASDATTAKSAGYFDKIRYTLGRQQPINEKVVLSINLTGQIAGKNLDSSEKFYLGGASGVRAFPNGEGGGSEGQMINLEAHIRPLPEWKLTAFYDWGTVKVNVNDYVGAVALNEFSLKGGGLSLTWERVNGVSASLTWAVRDGPNPNMTATGMDQDGTLVKDRVWLTLSIPF